MYIVYNFLGRPHSDGGSPAPPLESRSGCSGAAILRIPLEVFTRQNFFGQGVPSHYRATSIFKRDGYALSVFRQHFKRQETKNGKTVGLLLVRQN